MNLDGLDLKALKKLKIDVEKAIKHFESRKKREALSAVEETAKSMGFTLVELFEGSSMSRKKISVAPKYIHPENDQLTWSGRGRKPRWVLEYLSAGRSLDDLKV